MITAFLLVTTVLKAHAQIAPYKDALFANPRLIEQSKDFARYDYQEMRDINGRDEIPVAKVQAKYTDPLPSAEERRLEIRGVETYEAGNPKTAKFAVFFIHGGGGNGSLGFNDITFGGNFNRIKHLAVENDGVYESPSLTSFNDVSQIERILATINPQAKVIVACGSMGGVMCWELYSHKGLSKRLAGVILLGGHPHAFSKKEPGVKNRVPVYLSHGTADPIYDARVIADEFRWLQENNVPSKFALYETGKHGTPIRMIDWRETLNWMLSY